MSDAPGMIEERVREMLRRQAADMLARLKAGKPDLAREVMTIDPAVYTDPTRFEREKRQVFRRLPLMLAAGCELPQAGSFKAIDVAGVPILLIRARDGVARAFLNICTHRASPLATGCGQAMRLTCPYHGWTFDPHGRLLAAASATLYGAIDKSASGLTPLPLLERHGLIWVILDPAAPADFDPFLGSFGEMLGAFGFERWHFLARRSLPGANWKLALDAHLEFYHLPVLHRATFGPAMSNLAQYYYAGPHVRLGSFTKVKRGDDRRDLAGLAGRPQEEWPLEAQLFGEWILFPNVSINSFYKGGRSAVISQVLPGRTVAESETVQTWLRAEPPTGDQAERSTALVDFLTDVVGGEDLPMSRDQQNALDSGLVRRMQAGRNEGGVQHAHRWIAHALARPHAQSIKDWLGAGPDNP